MTVYTPADLVLIGGEFELSEASLTALLGAWDFQEAGMQFALSETIPDGIRFQMVDQLPPDMVSSDLMRLHIFGVGGDLTLRRDEDRVLWRYVGTYRPALPETLYRDFWAENSLEGLEADEAPLEALLWGAYDSQGQWRDDRVGKAIAAGRLDYSDFGQGGRVVSRACVLRDPRDGSIVAYWIYELASALTQEE